MADYSALMVEIRQMDLQQGAKLKPVSRKPEDGLILNTVDVAPTFGDAQLAEFSSSLHILLRPSWDEPQLRMPASTLWQSFAISAHYTWKEHALPATDWPNWLPSPS